MKNSIFITGWEDRLKDNLQSAQSLAKPYVYVCSPLNSDKREILLSNMKAAEAYMYYAHVMLNVRARAPHSFLPFLLCDSVPAERALALEFGTKLLEQCDCIMICGNRISRGMRDEIAHSARLHMNICLFCPELFDEVAEIVSTAGGQKEKIQLCASHTFMAMPSDKVTRVIAGEEEYDVVPI